jgi:hypothetical protein
MVILRLDAALYFANIGRAPTNLLTLAPLCGCTQRRACAGFLKERLRNEEKKNIAPLSRAPGKDVEEDTKKLYGSVHLIHHTVLSWCASLTT